MTATPRKPVNTPARRLPVILSSLVKKLATTTVNKGVVALKSPYQGANIERSTPRPLARLEIADGPS
jgi:hypothetical protein